jgi:hypothetical protein
MAIFFVCVFVCIFVCCVEENRGTIFCALVSKGTDSYIGDGDDSAELKAGVSRQGATTWRIDPEDRSGDGGARFAESATISIVIGFEDLWANAGALTMWLRRLP